jgi:4-amino-4-deoxy-L-arabinose transferase-like glycosyltransferase
LFFYNLITYLRDQSSKNELILSVSTGLALLTKSTFIPVALAIIFLVRFRQLFWKMVYRLTLCGTIIGLPGTYKYLENYRYHGEFFIHNLDIFDLSSNQIFYQRPQSYYNINIVTLIKDPNVSSRNHCTSASAIATLPSNA